MVIRNACNKQRVKDRHKAWNVNRRVIYVKPQHYTLTSSLIRDTVKYSSKANWKTAHEKVVRSQAWIARAASQTSKQVEQMCFNLNVLEKIRFSLDYCSEGWL